jgi:hypothetical protein
MRYEDEFRALLKPSISDYDELLRSGSVTRRPDDVEAWRADIRANARADKIQIRTGTADSDPSVAWAYLKHLDRPRPDDLDEVRSVLIQMNIIDSAFKDARRLGHDPFVLRSEKGQSAAVCHTCHAPAYFDFRTNPAIIDGPLVETHCVWADADASG